MRSLLGDRFLRRFASDLIQRRKHSPSKVNEQNPEVDADKAVGQDSPAAEEACEKKEIEEQYKLVNEEQNKKVEVESQKE